ncbi:MAG: endonuclease NucS [Thermoleophilia bacterium]
MRLIVARCEVRYQGRVSSVLPMAVRLLIVKQDGSVLVHSDAGGYKPLNWMTPVTRVTESEGLMVVEKGSGAKVERLEIHVEEILSDSEHDMGESLGLEKDGVERDLQEALAAAPEALGEGMRLVRREYPTPIGPVDLLCVDDDGYVAVEVKRVGTIDAVEQLGRYLEYIRSDPNLVDCRGMVVAETIKPQTQKLAASRGLYTRVVSLAELRGLREPELRLFGA